MEKIFATLLVALCAICTQAQVIDLYKGDSLVASYTADQVDCVEFRKADNTHGFTDGHEWVDLGLPSGTLWATCNVGAGNTKELGDFYSWGKTQAHGAFDYMDYTYGAGNFWAKYSGIDTLEPEDDIASVAWGNDWCMPSKGQMEELINYCTLEWVDNSIVLDENSLGKLTVGAIVFTSEFNHSTVSFPIFHYYGKSYGGAYWTNTSCNSNSAYLASFDSEDKVQVHDQMKNGLWPIRPVICSSRNNQ